MWSRGLGSLIRSFNTLIQGRMNISTWHVLQCPFINTTTTQCLLFLSTLLATVFMTIVALTILEDTKHQTMVILFSKIIRDASSYKLYSPKQELSILYMTTAVSMLLSSIQTCSEQR
jgi:hypothetical protein